MSNLKVNKWKKCTINYFRAEWVVDTAMPKTTLFRAISKCLDAFTTPRETITDLLEGKVAIAHRETSDTDCKLHMVNWTEGESMPVVQHKVLDLGAANPTVDSDYLDGEGMLFISGNHLLVLTNALLLHHVHQYLGKLINMALNQANVVQNKEAQFRIVRISDFELTRQLIQKGVKEIEIDVSNYLDTFHLEQEGEPRKIHPFQSFLKTVCSKIPADKESFNKNANMHAKLKIKLDQRKEGITAEQMGDAIDNTMIHQGEKLEGFTLVTKDGTKIKGNQLYLKHETKIGKVNNSKRISHQQAWKELCKYYNHLKATGKLSK